MALAAASVVVLAGVVVIVVRTVTAGSGPECRVPGRSGAVGLDLDAVQLQHASTINAVGISRGLPARARIIALATALQESTMRNLATGDRDSVGLFQQRPSQGWGTRTEIMDPVYSSGKFYDALVTVPGWQTGTLTKVAQAVQYSGFPDAYAKWEDEATTLVAGLSGGRPPDLSCRAGAVAPTAETPSRKPLPGTENAAAGLRTLLAAAGAELTGIRVDQLADGNRSAVVALAPPALDISSDVAAGVLAAWSVAHATGFGVIEVRIGSRRYADHLWSAGPAGPPVPAGQVRISVG
jgi:hypothetical protein